MAVMNAVNEEAVAGFFAGDLPFLGIVGTIQDVLADPARPRVEPADGVDALLDLEHWARTAARERIAARDQSIAARDRGAPQPAAVPTTSRERD